MHSLYIDIVDAYIVFYTRFILYYPNKTITLNIGMDTDMVTRLRIVLYALSRVRNFIKKIKRHSVNKNNHLANIFCLCSSVSRFFLKYAE